MPLSRIPRKLSSISSLVGELPRSQSERSQLPFKRLFGLLWYNQADEQLEGHSIYSNARWTPWMYAEPAREVRELLVAARRLVRRRAAGHRVLVDHCEGLERSRRKLTSLKQLVEASNSTRAANSDSYKLLLSVLLLLRFPFQRLVSCCNDRIYNN